MASTVDPSTAETAGLEALRVLLFVAGGVIGLGALIGEGMLLAPNRGLRGPKMHGWALLALPLLVLGSLLTLDRQRGRRVVGRRAIRAAYSERALASDLGAAHRTG